ncbi:unnamed protein product [Polarella glacialis]|uniref:Uncharacterized protein n=1 Tax=Polarella glacialis TaxID=89957 RepID=A0A813F5M4_POLGL|nr:unnamed protein product [Polarella glacialis]
MTNNKLFKHRFVLPNPDSAHTHTPLAMYTLRLVQCVATKITVQYIKNSHNHNSNHHNNNNNNNNHNNNNDNNNNHNNNNDFVRRVCLTGGCRQEGVPDGRLSSGGGA